MPNTKTTGGQGPTGGAATSHRFVSDSSERTQELAELIGSVLETGDVVTLTGELGAGKTTFAQGLCRGAGLGREIFVRSPTFTLMNEYRGRTAIRHADLYRIDSQEDLATIGLFDPAFAGITIIEWAEKHLEGMSPPPVVNVTLRELSETEREIIIEGAPERAESIRRVLTDR